MAIASRLRFAAAAAALALGAPALAQIDSLRMLVPANPGGGWDTTARELGKAMQAAGAAKNVQYDNKGGAAGTIGLAQFVAASRGDPNALLMGGMVMVGGIIQNKSAVNLSQVTPVARLTSEWEVIVVPANGPKTLKELLDKLKADPGSVSWGGGSAGGTDHILAGMVAKAVGVPPSRVNYVPFKGGGEAVAAIIGGHVTAGVSGLSEFAQHIKSGRMRALAVSSPRAIDGIASLKEQGIDVELSNWRGVFAPPGISRAQRDAMIAAVEKGVKSPAWQEALKRHDWADFWLAGDAYGAYVEEENRRLAGILAELALARK